MQGGRTNSQTWHIYLENSALIRENASPQSRFTLETACTIACGQPQGQGEFWSSICLNATALVSNFCPACWPILTGQRNIK